MYPEFIVDEEAERAECALHDALIALLRQLWEIRRTLQELKLSREEQVRREGEFLKQLLATKERRCDQFVAAERARGAMEGGDPNVRAEAEKWVHRLEVFQQSFDAALAKHGVTRYEPSGGALPDRDDIKDTVAGTGLARGTIVRILRPSYLWHGEVLRPAEVVVAE
jgi:molecular chaperone GrpE (heat shock protein)